MDNHEEILDALTAFGKSPNSQEIPTILEQYLNSVAKNGETLFSWSQLKPLILRKMELVITELRRNLASENIPNRPNVENVRFDVIHARIIDSLHKFNGAPFTIQRLCELLLDPKRHYKRSDKFMRGLEKNVLVVSTVDPFGRKVVCESGNKPVMNGILDINGSYPGRDTALSIPLPPVPGWVNTAATSPSRVAAAMPSVDSNKNPTDFEAMGKESEMVSNSESGGLAVSGSMFSDQNDHPLAVQSEEVVEETVVTMDTGEVSSVVTDGGEAMAEREMEGDLADDREASSFSSSSSSSSEELSTSSDSKNNPRTSQFAVTENSLPDATAMDENRPWAAFAQNISHVDDFTSQSTADNHLAENQTSAVSSSSPNNTHLEASSSPSSSPSSSETQSSYLSATTSSKVDADKSEKQDSPNQMTMSDQSHWQPCDDSSATANQSFGFEAAVNSASDQIETTSNPVAEKDKLVSSSTTTNSNTSEVNISVSSSVSVPTYAQVVASSTTDKSIHLSPHNSIETVPCDSVAGLERLVGSMEQSLSSSSSSLLSSSTAAHLSSSSSLSSFPSSHPALTTSTNSPVTTSSTSKSVTSLNQQVLPSSSDFCTSDGEPVSKRLRLSVEEESMEEDCISTSGDLCMEEDDAVGMEEEQQKEERVDSSVEEGEQENSQGGVQSEADADISGEADNTDENVTAQVFDSNSTSECSTELDSSADVEPVKESSAECQDEANQESSGGINPEPSDISTTDSEHQMSPEPVSNN